MARGNTATINFSTLRIHWDSHAPMAAICSHFSISKDQLIRLKKVVPLPPRHDRRLRFKPKRSEMRDPTPREIKQACKEIQAKWDARTREERAVIKTQTVHLRRIELTGDALDAYQQIEGD
jgi:hypothetical protein